MSKSKKDKQNKENEFNNNKKIADNIKAANNTDNNNQKLDALTLDSISYEKRKKVIYDLVNDDLYIPMNGN